MMVQAVNGSSGIGCAESVESGTGGYDGTIVGGKKVTPAVVKSSEAVIQEKPTNDRVERIVGKAKRERTISEVEDTYTLDARFSSIQETANFLLSRTKHRPQIAIVCGTGLGGLSELVEDAEEFPYKTIPNFPQTRVKGHVGRLLFGTLNGKCVVCMQGRVHAYEGHSMWQLTFPIRVFHAIGIRVMMVTNASGSVREDFKPGDLMVLRDHINLPGMAGLNPLIGPNDDRYGTRFPAMSGAYDTQLRRLLLQTAAELDKLSFVREGVYLCQSGPCYETPAECIMARILGADVCGMSTCPEVIVARHGRQPIRCVGLSMITNSCVMNYDDLTDGANHDEILGIADWRAKDLRDLVSTFIGKIPSELVA